MAPLDALHAAPLRGASPLPGFLLEAHDSIASLPSSSEWCHPLVGTDVSVRMRVPCKPVSLVRPPGCQSTGCVMGMIGGEASPPKGGPTLSHNC